MPPDTTAYILSPPLYQIPLGEDELIVMGRITVMWAHIDSQIDDIISALFRITPKEFDILVGDKMIGGKVKIIREHMNGHGTKALLDDMCAKLSDAIPDRNVMTHGRWGWQYKPEEHLFYRMAHSKRHSAPFYADKLFDLHERVCMAAIKVDEVWYKLLAPGDVRPNNSNRRWMMSPVPPEQIGGMPVADFSR